MRWRAVVAALDEHAAIRSRVSLYLHPLGGRPILWHVVRALLDARPEPDEVAILHLPGAAALGDLADVPAVRLEAVERGDEARALRAAVDVAETTVLADGAAPLLTPRTVERLVAAGGEGVASVGAGDAPDDADAPSVAVAGAGGALAACEDPRRPRAATPVPPIDGTELLRVHDRRTMDLAGVALRDRLVRQHEANGVSFVLPETTWLDVPVRIGPDTVVYPGCVLEGTTEIGAECVIGPHSRVIDSVIGRGVELRGWNYLCRTHVRNRAVLEPFSRRGGD